MIKNEIVPSTQPFLNLLINDEKSINFFNYENPTLWLELYLAARHVDDTTKTGQIKLESEAT